MKRCPNCDVDFNDTLDECEYCGTQLKAIQNNKIPWGKFWGGIGVAVITFIPSLYLMSNALPSSYPNYVEPDLMSQLLACLSLCLGIFVCLIPTIIDIKKGKPGAWWWVLGPTCATAILFLLFGGCIFPLMS